MQFDPNLTAFFNNTTRRRLGATAPRPGSAPETLGPTLKVDALPDAVLRGALAQPASLMYQLEELEPFGRGFEPVVFALSGQVRGCREMSGGKHWKLKLDGVAGDVVWFNAPETPTPRPGASVRLAVSPQWNEYRGERKVQLLVQDGREDF